MKCDAPIEAGKPLAVFDKKEWHIDCLKCTECEVRSGVECSAFHGGRGGGRGGGEDGSETYAALNLLLSEKLISRV